MKFTTIFNDGDYCADRLKPGSQYDARASVAFTLRCVERKRYCEHDFTPTSVDGRLRSFTLVDARRNAGVEINSTLASPS